MSRTPDLASHGSRRTEWTKLGIVGFPLACLALLVNVSIRRLFVSSALDEIPLFGLPRVEIEAPIVPFGSTGHDLGVWVAAWLEGLFHAGLLTGYYVSWGAFLVGSLFTLAALVMGKDPRRLLGGFMLIARDRRLHLFLVFQAVLWIASFNPWLVALATELAIILVAAGSVFILSGTTLLAISDRCGPVATVVVVHPLAALTAALPPISAALVSPLFRDGARWLTTELTVWLLLNVLQPVGLSRLLQRRFDLEGAGFLLLWTVLLVVVGWLVGGTRYARNEGDRWTLR